MLRRFGSMLLNRQDVIGGPGSAQSLSRFGPMADPQPTPDYLKRKFRLSLQKHMQKDSREKRYAFCSRCGLTTMTVNFDRVPSARLGLFGKCKDGRDFTHHKFTTLKESEYRALQSVKMEDRATWLNFDSRPD